MKICWDNLENIEWYDAGNCFRKTDYRKHGYKAYRYYEERDSCKVCEDPYLTNKHIPSEVCSHSCRQSFRAVGTRFGHLVAIKRINLDEENRGLWEFKCDCGGKIIRPIRFKRNDRVFPASCGCKPTSGPDLTGQKFGKLTVIKFTGRDEKHGNLSWLCKCDCGNEKTVVGSNMIIGHTRSCGCNYFPYGVSVKELDLPMYDTYKDIFKGIEEISYVIKYDLKVLEVKCTYCGRFSVPTISRTVDRACYIRGTGKYEARFYCGDSCKLGCPIFNQNKYPKGFKKTTSREVQAELRQLVLKRDDYTCQYGDCGLTVDNAEIHCHHIEGVRQNPIESADMNICISLCKKHHKYVHTQEGCRYFELRCKGEES